jgi:hypothetical protein
MSSEPATLRVGLPYGPAVDERRDGHQQHPDQALLDPHPQRVAAGRDGHDEQDPDGGDGRDEADADVGGPPAFLGLAGAMSQAAAAATAVNLSMRITKGKG